MTYEFYGPKKDAELAINKLLSLPATGNEQDWEYELSDASKIDQMLDLLGSSALDMDQAGALALLLISSIQDAERQGVLSDSHVLMASALLANNDLVRERMKFYWLGLERADNTSLVRRIIETNENG